MTPAGKERLATVTGAVSGQGFFAVVVWGASFAATRVALDTLNPFGLIAVRLWTGALLLALVIVIRRGRLLPRRADVPRCLLLGAVLAAHLLIQAYGLYYTSAINTGWIIGFIPVTIALGAFALGQQRLNRTGWSGVAVGTGGVFLVTMIAPPDFKQAHFGDLLQVASCLTWTVYTLAASGPNARSGVLSVTTFGMAVAAAIATLATLGTGAVSGPLTARSLGALVFLGVVCSGVAYYLWFAAIEGHGPARVGALLYIEPFVALITGAVLLHEHVMPQALAGGVLVLLGVWLVSRGAARPASTTRRPTPASATKQTARVVLPPTRPRISVARRAERRSMIHSVSPTIYVSDLDRAVRFYSEVLGLKVTIHAPGHWAGLAAPDGTNLGLHPAGAHSPKPGTNGAIQLGLAVGRPLEQVVTELKSRGVEFHGPIVNDTKVRLAFFNDPDGNALYLCEVTW